MSNPVSPTSEPLRFVAAALALVNAGLVLVVAFGVSLTPEQTGAVMGFANAVLLFAALVWARRKVAAVDSISVRVDDDGNAVATFADGSELSSKGN